MRLPRTLTLAVCFLCQSVEGMFMWYETQEVPIGRLTTNLQQRLARDTNDFETTYDVARLRAMAYASEVPTIEVRSNTSAPVFAMPGSDTGVPPHVRRFYSENDRRLALGQLTNAIEMYERALILLKRSTNAAQSVWMVVPTQLGLAWCLDQAGQTNAAIAMYRKALQSAWQREVTGDFDFRRWATDVWDDVRAGRNPVHQRHNGSIGPGVCYSEETIGYLLRLLDPVKDSAEIARLKQDQSTLVSMGRAITPVIVPLEPGTPFEDLIDLSHSVVFDLDGSGLPRRWAWLTPKAGWLVYDPKQAGRITSALQMFGNVSFWIFWSDGYQALSALDDNGDGQISGSELNGLAVWCDRNRNGISDPGEVVPVEELGIQVISCSRSNRADGLLWNACGLVLTNGDARPTYDWVAPSSPSEQ